MVAGRANERFKALSEARRRLLRLMQDINFGQIEFLMRQADPDFRQPWRTRRTIKLTGGDNCTRPEGASADFELRKEHVALFDQLAQLRDGACVIIEVKHGLPFIAEIEQEYRAG